MLGSFINSLSLILTAKTVASDFILGATGEKAKTESTELKDSGPKTQEVIEDNFVSLSNILETVTGFDIEDSKKSKNNFSFSDLYDNVTNGFNQFIYKPVVNALSSASDFVDDKLVSAPSNFVSSSFYSASWYSEPEENYFSTNTTNTATAFSPSPEYYISPPPPAPPSPPPEKSEPEKREEDEKSILLLENKNQSETKLAELNQLTKAQRIAQTFGKFVSPTVTVAEVLKDLLESSDISFGRLSYETSKLGLNITDLVANLHKDGNCEKLNEEISKFLVLAA